MEEIGTLIKELTQLAITARTYLNLRAVKEGLIAAPAGNEGTTAPAKETRKAAATSKKTTEKEPEAAPAPAAKTVAAALGTDKADSMSEKESLDVAFKLAAAFIQKDGADKQADNKNLLRAYIQKAYNASQVSAIKHPQRVEFIEWLKTETAPKELVS